MAIENTYLLGKNITLGCGFDLQAKAPLDSRQTVPSFEGLRALIIGDAAYEGMIVYDEGTKKTYQAQKCESYSVEVDGKTKTYDIAFREFGINESELKELIASETTAAMEFKGATAALPENPAKGDMWKVTASFEVAGETTKVGDSIVYNGEEWFRIPSGDDIEDTWRIVKVEGTSLGGISEGKELNLTAGDKLDVTINTDGAVVYSHEAIDAPELLAENEQTRTYITAVETDGYGHITGYKTATENVEDSNTTYEFEGLPVGEDEAAPSSVYFQVASKENGAEAGTPEVIYLDAYSKNEADAKFVESVSIASSEEGKVQLTVDGTAQTAVEINGFADLVAKKHEHSFSDEAALNGITAAKVADWDDAVSKEHTHTFADSDVEDAISKKHSHAFADTDVEDAIAKKHSHSFVEAELNKIADGDVAKWNTAAGKATTALQPTAISNGLARNMGNNYVDVAFEDEDGTGATITSFGIKGEGDYITVSNGTSNTGANAGGATSAAVISVNIPDASENEKGLVTLGEISAAEQNAKDYTDDEIEKLDLGTMSKEAAIDYVKKSDATGYDDILTKTDAQSTYVTKNDLADAGAELIGSDSDDPDANTIHGVRNYAYAVGSVVAGTEDDTYSDITIYGARKYADKLVEEAAAGLGDLATLDTITADKVTDFATEVAKVKVNEAVKATQDGNGNVIADTYAEKANTYTKSEVEALLTWGSF